MVVFVCKIHCLSFHHKKAIHRTQGYLDYDWVSPFIQVSWIRPYAVELKIILHIQKVCFSHFVHELQVSVASISRLFYCLLLCGYFIYRVIPLRGAAVTWLKYCRYGVKRYPINQSTTGGKTSLLCCIS